MHASWPNQGGLGRGCPCPESRHRVSEGQDARSERPAMGRGHPRPTRRATSHASKNCKSRRESDRRFAGVTIRHSRKGRLGEQRTPAVEKLGFSNGQRSGLSEPAFASGPWRAFSTDSQEITRNIVEPLVLVSFGLLKISSVRHAPAISRKKVTITGRQVLLDIAVLIGIAWAFPRCLTLASLVPE